MNTYSIESINPKYLSTVKEILKEIGQEDATTISEYHLLFCPGFINDDFFIKEG